MDQIVHINPIIDVGLLFLGWFLSFLRLHLDVFVIFEANLIDFEAVEWERAVFGELFGFFFIILLQDSQKVLQDTVSNKSVQVFENFELGVLRIIEFEVKRCLGFA